MWMRFCCDVILNSSLTQHFLAFSRFSRGEPGGDPRGGLLLVNFALAPWCFKRGVLGYTLQNLSSRHPLIVPMPVGHRRSALARSRVVLAIGVDLIQAF